MSTVSCSNPIHVIGTDASGLENLPLHLKQLTLSANKVAAPKRLHKHLSTWWRKENKEDPLPEVLATDQPKALVNWLKQQKELSIVLASCDPLWFGIGRSLSENFPQQRLHFHPSPSSLQLAFARLGRSWQDTSWISIHGRDPTPLFNLLRKRPKSLTVLTDPNRGGAQEVREVLKASGLEQSYELWIFEQLGHPNEKVYRVMPKDKPTRNIHPLHLVILISNEINEPNPKIIPIFGLEDGLFLQHEDCPGLMTKREVRVQILAELELPKEGVLWDIGAGVGSIGIEALRLNPKLKLLSIEKRTGGSDLINRNAKRLSVKPSLIIEEDALEVINSSQLPTMIAKPDRVILGGGGVNRKELLKLILKTLKPTGIVVVPLATVEAISEIKEILKSADCILNIHQFQSWRGLVLGEGTRFAPINPVFIVKGKKP